MGNTASSVCNIVAPRHIFFSFHHEDSWRVNQVRNSGIFRGIYKAGFVDHAEREKVKQKGSAGIKEWIDEQLHGTSVTVILVGSKTHERIWVNYEIKQSYLRNNGILVIYIDGLRNHYGQTCNRGLNPLDYWQVDQNGKSIILSSLCRSYDWIDDDGYNNLSTWIETAAVNVGRMRTKDRLVSYDHNIKHSIQTQRSLSNLNLKQKTLNDIDGGKKYQYSKIKKSALININYASKEELMTLKNIGVIKAKAIIEYRECRGFFRNIEELTNVKYVNGKNIGITGKILNDMRSHITISY